MNVWWLLTLTLTVTVSCHCQNTTTRICKSVDIRNKPEHLELLRGCHVVEGYVRIVLMERGVERDFDLHSVPELREITEYLMFYRVIGLRRVGQIFPNLTVIRGETLFQDYALVVYEMINLQEISLHSLTDIMRGAVRIEKNPSLCYVETVDWARIAQWDPDKNYISNNKPAESCPGCDSACPHGLCWSRSHCQVELNSVENSDCDPGCIGGCSGSGPKDCFICRKYLDLDNICVDHCPSGTLQYLNRRCIIEAECISTWVPEETCELRNLPMSEHLIHKYLIFNNSCVDHCPAGYEPDTRTSRCKLCEDGKCSKVCPGSNIENIAAAQALQGCTHIQGSLEISIRSGKPNTIAQELEESLGSIEEIRGCLKITRSTPIVNLYFLKNLTTIHGESNERYAMYIKENPNLQELWDWNTKLDFNILNSRLFFHHNPKLCLYHIMKLIEIVHQENVTNQEVGKESNGYKVPCQAAEINVSTAHITSYCITIHIPFVKIEAENSFLRFEVHYVKDPGESVSLFDDVDQCTDHKWTIKDLSVDMSDKHFINNGVNTNLTELEPNTKYVFSVVAFTVDHIAATSGLLSATTLPAKPSELVAVRAFSNSSSEIVVSWKPPMEINGVLEEFVVTWSLLDKDESIVYLRDYCEHPIVHEDNPKPPIDDYDKILQNETCLCSKEIMNTPKDGFENLCSNNQYFSPVGFPTLDSTRSCEAYFNKYLLHNVLKDYTDSRELSYSEDSLVVYKDYKFPEKNKTGNRVNFKYNIKTLSPTARNFTIRGLKHYSDYVVTVKACRERSVVETNFEDEVRCSKIDIISVRTHQDESSDLVMASSIKYEIYNKTVFVSWDAPLHPNGVLVAFELEYRQRENINPKLITPYCISYIEFKTNKNGHAIHDLLPGKYELRIRTVTFAGKGCFSDFIPFVISSDLATTENMIITLLVLFVLVFLTLGVTVLKCLQKNRTNLDDILIASVNPEYHYSSDQWEISKEHIVFGEQIGCGTFGKVYKGTLKETDTACAIKTVNEGASSFERNVFLNEASVMKSVSGAYHIVQLLGVVSLEIPPLVVMELMELGDLRSFLMSVRDNHPPSEQTKLKIAAQIADGLCFMEARKFVHRDLAARNCLVKGDLTVKVGDFGMTRDIYETDYYRKTDKGLLPIRWMAPESLKDGLFTTQSDVWSYGVVLWEIVTLGEQPYQGASNEQVFREVVNDRLKLEVPSNCPRVFRTLMVNCWKTKPEYRMNFMQILTSLEYYTHEDFKSVSFFHSNEAINIRRSLPDYVEMWNVEDPLLSGFPEAFKNGEISLLPFTPPTSHKFSLKLATLAEDSDISSDDS